MRRSKKGKSAYAHIRVWRAPDSSIHMSIDGIKGGLVKVNQGALKVNGHPTLFARLDKLLNEAVPKGPDEIRVQFIAANGKVTTGPVFKLPRSN